MLNLILQLIDGKCDLCGSEVIQRKDDTVEETVKERLDVYERQTQPLIDFYKEKNYFQQ